MVRSRGRGVAGIQDDANGEGNFSDCRSVRPKVVVIGVRRSKWERREQNEYEYCKMGKLGIMAPSGHLRCNWDILERLRIQFALISLP